MGTPEGKGAERIFEKVNSPKLSKFNNRNNTSKKLHKRYVEYTQKVLS